MEVVGQQCGPVSRLTAKYPAKKPTTRAGTPAPVRYGQKGRTGRGGGRADGVRGAGGGRPLG